MATKHWALPLSCFAAGVAGGSLLRADPPAPPQPKQQTNRDQPVDMFEAVGNTPLLELKSLSRLTGCKIYAKAEFMNPCGSVKDRAAKYLLLDAEEKGLITKGDVVVEATGGNTGISLALLAAARGYRTLFTMPAKTATEKIELMKTMGAEVHVQPMASMFDKDVHFYHVAHKLAKENKNAVYPDQFENLASTRAHYETTGPEIWHQTGGQLDGFICASGTAGTIGGTTKFLKEKNPAVKTWIIDSEEVAAMAKFINDGQTTSTEKEGFEIVPAGQGATIAEGIGLPRVTPNFREAKIDQGITGTNQEIVDMAYFLLKNEGVFVGPSAALNVVGAVKMARALGPGHAVVTILCDGGDRYRSKLYNPTWLEQQKLVPKSGDKLSLDFVADAKLP